MKVAILDMQPIEPAVGGGRLRLLGLYHGLGLDIRATYVGTYDWPGPGYRRHMLSDTLEEIDIPLSDAHFDAAEDAKQRAGGKNVIDCVFHLQAHHSPEYVAKAREVARDADVIVFSHPWIFPLTRDVLDFSRQLIVYDSHNVEGVLRYDLLNDEAGGTEVAREVKHFDAGIVLRNRADHLRRTVDTAVVHEDQFPRLARGLHRVFSRSRTYSHTRRL